MRSWQADPLIDQRTSSADAFGRVVADVVPALGDPRFGALLLAGLRGMLSVGSLSVYQTGSRPAIYLSASLDVPDTTRDCWRAYLSGPIRGDRTLLLDHDAVHSQAPRMCHITAPEVPAEHRAKVYDAHGVAERISVVQEDAAQGVFALNFYRHQHQRPLSDAQLDDFGRMGAALMALTRKHIDLSRPRGSAQGIDAAADRLLALQPALTARELEVCTRLLRGMTQEGIAADLGIGLPTVKTYRNRAFGRLGIHFRSELFALMLDAARRPELAS